MKFCVRCGKEKGLNDFSPDPKMKSRRKSHCKSCCRVSAKLHYSNNKKELSDRVLVWQRANPDKVKACNDSWRQRNPEKKILAYAKSSAKKRGLDFQLTEKDVIIPTKCPVLGIPLSFSPKRGPGLPSLDRINNDLGYVQGNVCVISWRANHLKNNGTLEEFKALVGYMERAQWTSR